MPPGTCSDRRWAKPAAQPDSAVLRLALQEPAIAISLGLAGIALVPGSRPVVPQSTRVAFQDGGARGARLVFTFEERLGEYLVLKMYASLGLILEPGEREAALAELGNCFMGHIDGRLAALGLDLEFSIPEVERGALSGERQEPEAAVVLDSAQGALGIDLYLRTR